MIYRARTRADGKLVKACRPAIYLDSSVLIDYWQADGLEIAEPDETSCEQPQRSELLRGILRADRRLQKVAAIRARLLLNGSSITAVISPLCVLELIEWLSADALKELASGVAAVQFVQKQGRKQIGDCLSEIMKRRQEEEDKWRAGSSRPIHSSALERILLDVWPDQSYAHSHGLDGLSYANIEKLALRYDDAWGPLSLCAYLQLGAADIMHLMCAHHLGCELFATFDADFTRVRDFAAEHLGMKVLCSPEEVLTVLQVDTA